MARNTQALCALLLASACGCERGGQERTSATASAPATVSPAPTQSAAEPPASPRRPKCILTLPADAPPHQKPSPVCPKDVQGPPVLPRGWVSFPDAPSAPRVAVEFALTEAARERGLMYRTSMPDEQGMVFSWTDAAERSFWMHDTCIPLDMLYVGEDGFIAGIVEEAPPMNDAPRGIPCPVVHVIEVNAGWARGHGVAPGQRVVVEK